MSNYLLMYTEGGESSYTWFDSESELLEYIEDYRGRIEVEEALELTITRDLVKEGIVNETTNSQ